MMSDIDITETSGVDHPAHLSEGWVVIKSASPEAVSAALAALSTEEPPMADTTPTADMDDLMKSAPAPVREALAKARALADEALQKAAAAEARLTEQVNKARDAEKSAFLKSLSSLTIGDEVAKQLRELEDVAPELAKAVEGILAAANGQAESAAIFAEVGKSARPGQGSTAVEKLTVLAKARAEADNTSFAVAMDRVAQAEPQLYADYLAEQRG